MSKRIALLGIYHESNTFVPEKTTLEHFRSSRYLKGADIIREYADAHHEMGGMIEVINRSGMELVPVLYAESTPGGTITARAYEALKAELLAELDQVLPVDGILVVPHGAGVSESHPDMDGDWLNAVRQRVGSEIPIVGTLDLHANVSPQMVTSTDALVSYRENPHIDQRARGKEAAELLVRKLNGQIELAQVLLQLPLAISIEQQLTSEDPCRSFYAYARELAKRDGVLSLSIQLGFPYADVEEMGTSVIVVTDGQPDLALHTAEQLQAYALEHKRSFVGDMLSAPEAVDQVAGSEKPVLLLDMGDNIGGGSPGNNICLLEELEKKSDLRYFVCLYDPEAVQILQQHGKDETVTITISGIKGTVDTAYSLEVRLEQLTDGLFREHSPRHGGQVNYNMGDTAIVRTGNGSTIMLTSRRIPPFSLQQLLTFGVDPLEFDAVVAKGVNAPIAAYAPVCPTVIQVDTPGVTQADMTRFEYRHRRHPLFPFEG